MSKDTNLEKDNSEPKGIKPFLESCIMHLGKQKYATWP